MQNTKNTTGKLIAIAAIAGLSATAGTPAARAQYGYDNSDSTQSQSDYNYSDSSRSQPGYYNNSGSTRVTLNPGTVIPVVLNDELTSRDSTSGDRFTATVDTSRNVYNRMLSGATVDGEVVDSTSQDGSHPGTLSLRFTQLRMANGETFAISGTPTSLDSKNVRLRSDGTLESKTRKSGQNQSTTYAGIGAGAGLLLDVLKGGKLNLGDILIGGGLGYGAGELLKNKNQQVHDVELRPGTKMGVVLGKRLLFHRRSSSTMNDYTNDTNGGNVSNYPSQGGQWKNNTYSGDQGQLSSPSYNGPVYNTQAAPQTNKRYYSYNGHAYSLDLNTGERMKLD